MNKNNLEMLTRLLLFFDSNAMTRGLNYYESGLVVSCDLKYIGSDIVIHSSVEGTYLYTQEIVIDAENLSVSGECSCPVGYNCKHVVASIFKAFSKPLPPKRSRKKEYEIWLDQIVEADEDKPSTDMRLDKNHFLIYKLFIDQYGNDVGFYKAKILKNGNISKGAKISTDRLFYSYQYSYNFLSQEDMDIIPLLENLTDRYGNSIELRGELGAIALKKIVENIRVAMEKKLRDAIKEKGLNRSHIMILDALLKLRQVCCHPQLLKLESAKKIQESVKLEMFLELVETLMAEGKKVLVFSQFTSMLSILEEEIRSRKIKYSKLTGATRKREEAIEKFTKGDADIFLISLKAGGVGLNLVEADTVIHYDPWWNPAVENQATDRAYRIGQDKAVFVYKLVVENSIEEKIVELQEKKKSISEGIYSQKEQESISGEDLLELLSI